MDKALRLLVAKANKASSVVRWGCYPMAPSIGLTDKEISLHAKAMQAHGTAELALIEAGLVEEASKHRKAIDSHSWVVNKLGNF